MRITTLPILFFVLLSVHHQDRSKQVDLDKEFRVRNGGEVVVKGEKLRLTLKSVSDSRCPTGVTCVWAGNGGVVLELALGNNKPIEATLNTTLEPREITQLGFRIKLVALNPHPRVNESIDPKQYEAIFIVTKDK